MGCKQKPTTPILVKMLKYLASLSFLIVLRLGAGPNAMHDQENIVLANPVSIDLLLEAINEYFAEDGREPFLSRYLEGDLRFIGIVEKGSAALLGKGRATIVLGRERGKLTLETSSGILFYELEYCDSPVVLFSHSIDAYGE